MSVSIMSNFNWTVEVIPLEWHVFFSGFNLLSSVSIKQTIINLNYEILASFSVQ